MRGDALASGARRAQFPSAGDGEDILRNVASEEEYEQSQREKAELSEKFKIAEGPKKVFRPLNHVLLVRRIKLENLSTVIIEDTMEKEQPAEGYVLAIGAKV